MEGFHPWRITEVWFLIKLDKAKQGLSSSLFASHFLKFKTDCFIAWLTDLLFDCWIGLFSWFQYDLMIDDHFIAWLVVNKLICTLYPSQEMSHHPSLLPFRIIINFPIDYWRMDRSFFGRFLFSFYIFNPSVVMPLYFMPFDHSLDYIYLLPSHSNYLSLCIIRSISKKGHYTIVKSR